MKRLPLPEIKVDSVIVDCANGVSDSDKRHRLLGLNQFLSVQEQAYISNATNGQWHLVPQLVRLTGSNGTVSCEEMVSLYETRMVDSRAGRVTYDQIKASAPHNKCPFCNQRIVSTIDHYLPKKLFPAFAITPCNLVPSCSDCNRLKSDVVPTTSERCIHPYFADARVETQVWLEADLGHGPRVSFSVASSAGTLPTTILDSLRFQFAKLGLASLYAANAAAELAGSNKLFFGHFEREGSSGLRSLLVELRDSWSGLSINCWQSALYRACSTSADFCEGKLFL